MAVLKINPFTAEVISEASQFRKNAVSPLQFLLAKSVSNYQQFQYLSIKPLLRAVFILPLLS
jgi:hypothetical protein